MRASFRLGRLAGVEIGVHWSVLIVFGLIAWLLTAIRFPAAYPGHPVPAYVVAGLSAAIVFFAGLLAHELSHAIVAKRHGLQAEGITLWIFGGVARLSGQPRSPGADLRIAGVGPLVSLMLGFGFGAVATVVAVAGETGLIFGTFMWLAGINIVLAVFNALPAAPLDGGRILRAALWKWRGDRRWAAVTAARTGKVLGIVLIVVGVWQTFAGLGFGALWWALIGWFLYSAADAEEQQARIGAALTDVRVRDIMSPDPLTAPADISVAELVNRHLLPSRHSAFPLVTDGRPTGLVTFNRIRRIPQERWSDTAAGDIACTAGDLTIVSPDDTVADVLPRLRECADGRALVVRNDHLIGIITPTDISRVLQLAALRDNAITRI